MLYLRLQAVWSQGSVAGVGPQSPWAAHHVRRTVWTCSQSHIPGARPWRAGFLLLTAASLSGMPTCPSALAPLLLGAGSTSWQGVSSEGLISPSCQPPGGTFPCFSLTVGLGNAGSLQVRLSC